MISGVLLVVFSMFTEITNILGQIGLVVGNIIHDVLVVVGQIWVQEWITLDEGIRSLVVAYNNFYGR